MLLLSSFRRLLLGGMLAATGALAGAEPAPLAAIPDLDLRSYLGRWHELARYPNRFQQQCVADTTADYALLPDGGVQVSNRCRLADGRFDEAVGRARQIGGPRSAQLQVRFAPAWLGWLPQVWGDYWVVDLQRDERGQPRLSIVSEPSRQYLWVLSRQPRLDADDWQRVNARLIELGFEPQRLLRATAD